MERVRREKPQLLIGSPICTAFSCIQALSWGRMAPDQKSKMLSRYVLHEHPATATSWSDPKVVAFMKKAG
eukprot:15455393-Heterocapsa_arctica.AAC.1